jgi:hypothetical protein
VQGLEDLHQARDDLDVEGLRARHGHLDAGRQYQFAPRCVRKPGVSETLVSFGPLSMLAFFAAVLDAAEDGGPLRM